MFHKIEKIQKQMSSKDKTIGEPCQDSVLEEEDTRTVKKTTRIPELQEEDGNSHSGNMNTEVKILYETVRQWLMFSNFHNSIIAWLH